MSDEIQYCQANGLRFAYLEEGTGPLVLMVHGFPDTPQTWDAARPAVAKAGFRVVTPWTRGYAPTEVFQGALRDLDVLGEDLMAIVDALGEKEVVLVGHDWGAGAVFSALGLQPERIRFAVTIGVPHVAAVKPTLGLAWKVRHFFTLPIPGAAGRIRRGGMKHLDELVQRWSPVWKIPPGETDAAKRSLGEPGSLEASLEYYKANRPKVPPAQRKKVKPPSAAFAGLDDTIPPELYEVARSRYEGPHEIVRIHGGHFMHREHPEQFIPELLRLLAPYR
jgi:pimeloyl-ACP methyl ester carboxylesterase